MSADDSILPMSGGDGESSYAANSKIQEKAIVESRPLLRDAVEAAHAWLSAGPGSSTLVVADLGCSSGPNTLLVVSEVLSVLAGIGTDSDRRLCEVQFFLNDLPGNDFNLVFRSLELFHKKEKKKEKGGAAPRYYVAGSPGSFYTRLFPERSVHLFHSSYCLMIRSKVPEEAGSLNQGNFYIWETTPPSVVKLYQQQFREDFSEFLKHRHTELVADGQMVLTFLGRKNKDVLRGEMCYIWGLLSQALQTMVQQGRVEKEKLDSFNLPMYAPSLDEVEAVIQQSQLFDVNHISLSQPNWDPLDDSDGEVVLDSVQSGINVARQARPVIGPVLAREFGEHVLDDLFEMYAQNVAKHLEKVKTRYAVIHLSLKARPAGHPELK